MRLTKDEKDLFATLRNNDKKFLRQLSKWVIKYYGNVNVAQKLNCISLTLPHPKDKE